MSVVVVDAADGVIETKNTVVQFDKQAASGRRHTTCFESWMPKMDTDSDTSVGDEDSDSSVGDDSFDASPCSWGDLSPKTPAARLLETPTHAFLPVGAASTSFPSPRVRPDVSEQETEWDDMSPKTP